MKLILAATIGGSFVAAEVVNPALNECLAVVEPDIDRTDATIINPEGDPIAVEFVIECGAEGGDDLFTFRYEAETEDMEPTVEAISEVVTGPPGAP